MNHCVTSCSFVSESRMNCWTNFVSSFSLSLFFYNETRLIFFSVFAETSRISSRGKGSVYSKGGGSRTLSKRFLNGNIITYDRSNRSLRATCELTTPTWYPGFLRGTSNGQAACMIIEDYPPLPTKPRQYLHQDTTQRFLNHLVLPKHRTSKFSRLASNSIPFFFLHCLYMSN